MIDPQLMSSAERLLWSYGVTEPAHIDLEAIANDHGAHVKYRPLGGCEARLVARGDSAIISVNSNSKCRRQRFSLAHELAHWMRDRKTGSFVCAKEDIGPQNAEAKTVEALANNYASQLILPSYLVNPWLQGRKATLDVASDLGGDFNVSLTAAAIKLIKCTPHAACLVRHSQSERVRFQRSHSFPQELYVLSELHQDTDAFGLAFGDGEGLTRAKKEPASRWLSGRDTYRMEVMTQSVKLPDATILTMILLKA